MTFSQLSRCPIWAYQRARATNKIIKWFSPINVQEVFRCRQHARVNSLAMTSAKSLRGQRICVFRTLRGGSHFMIPVSLPALGLAQHDDHNRRGNCARMKMPAQRFLHGGACSEVPVQRCLHEHVCPKVVAQRCLHLYGNACAEVLARRGPYFGVPKVFCGMFVMLQFAVNPACTKLQLCRFPPLCPKLCTSNVDPTMHLAFAPCGVLAESSRSPAESVHPPRGVRTPSVSQKSVCFIHGMHPRGGLRRVHGFKYIILK